MSGPPTVVSHWLLAKGLSHFLGILCRGQLTRFAGLIEESEQHRAKRATKKEVTATCNIIL
jgi:hypothetical protein